MTLEGPSISVSAFMLTKPFILQRKQVRKRFLRLSEFDLLGPVVLINLWFDLFFTNQIFVQFVKIKSSYMWIKWSLRLKSFLQNKVSDFFPKIGGAETLFRRGEGGEKI